MSNIKKSIICLIIGIGISLLALGSQSGLLSNQNFEAIKNDPATLFSTTNSCRLKSILGAKDYGLFRESMTLMTEEDEPANYLSIAGNVRGLFTVFEGFFRMSNSGKIWIAYLFDNEVHYFTNDEASLKSPPPIMIKWSSRFENVKWISKQITVAPNSCG